MPSRPARSWARSRHKPLQPTGTQLRANSAREYVDEVERGVPIDAVGTHRHRLRLEREALLRLRPRCLEVQRGLERRHARSIEAAAMQPGPLPALERKRPSGMMRAMDDAGEPPERQRHAKPPTASGKIGAHVIGTILADEFLGRHVAKGRQGLQAIPSIGRQLRPRPWEHAIEDLGDLAQAALHGGANYANASRRSPATVPASAASSVCAIRSTSTEASSHYCPGIPHSPPAR